MQDAGARSNGVPETRALAHRAADASGVTLRRFESLEDADRILRVLRRRWGGHEPSPGR